VLFRSCFTGTSRESADIVRLQREHIEKGSAEETEAMHRVKEEAARMKEALLRGNFDELARAMGRGWQAKKSTARTVSNPLIEETMEVAMAAGARAGKVSGAGGGGYIMLLVEPTRRMDVWRALTVRGTSVLGFQFSQHGTQGWRID
jgi:D-glycero-alpha-D-manno-heptose-7-phosphate kinase